MSNDPYGTRTRVAAVKGQCPRPLDEGAMAMVQINLTITVRSCNEDLEEPSRVRARRLQLLRTFSLSAEIGPKLTPSVVMARFVNKQKTSKSYTGGLF